MYSSISEEAKQALKSNAVVTTARITLTSNNTVIDGTHLCTVKIIDQCYENGVIIGTTMAKEVEIELINDNYDLADKEFSLEIGVQLSENLYEYIPFGNFIVKEYNDMKSNNHFKIIAYDYMDKLNANFTDNNDYSSPITLQEFYEYFATFYDIEIETQTLPNQSFLITQKPYFDGMSGRQVLSRIAEMFGSFAKFNRNNKLQMYLQTTTNEQISRNEMNTSLERNKIFGPINAVSLALSQIEGENVTLKDDESIELYGETDLVITDNPFVYTEDLRTEAITDIFERIDGFKYYPTSFNFKLLYFDCGDIVQIQDMNTNTYYNTMILKQILEIPSTIKSKCENLALTKTGVAHQYVPESVRQQKRTEYMVDKENQQITQIISNVDGLITTTTQQQADLSGITTTVSQQTSQLNEISNEVDTISETVSSTEQKLDSYTISFQKNITDLNDGLSNNTTTINEMKYEFNTDDLIIAKQNEAVNSRINNTGMRVYSYQELKAVFNDIGSGVQKLIVVGDSQLGNLQIIKAVDENNVACTDFHYLISNIQTLDDLDRR